MSSQYINLYVGGFKDTASAASTMMKATRATKRCKNRSNVHQSSDSDSESHASESWLLPGLPNHLARHCLSTLHPSLLYWVSRSWRSVIYSPSFPPFFSLYALLLQTTNTNNTTALNQPNPKPNPIPVPPYFFSLDPFSSSWHPLPTSPPLCLLRRHPSFISRNLSIQSLAVSGRLILIAATTHTFLPAVQCPLVFDPASKLWSLGPALAAPRRWCTAGTMGGAVYVASGVGAQYQRQVARCVERWQVKGRESGEWRWEDAAALRDGRFSREAVEAVGLRGKLCMVNVKGSGLKQGAVYDAADDRWEDMPEGMLRGWSGPAAATVDDEDSMYVVDEAKGALRKYSHDTDSWEELIESAAYLKDAEQMAAGRGRVCVVCGGGGKIAVVDVVAKPPKVWLVSPPPEMEVVAVHILPRMSG